MRFSQQVYWGGLLFPPPVDHVLSELSAMTSPSWVALHCLAHNFIELHKPLCHDKAVICEGPNLESVLKSRDITLPTKVHIVKVMVFSVVTYSCECWMVKKVEPWRMDAFELFCWRRLLRVLWTARRSNQSILREINSEYSLEGLMLKLKLQYFGHLMLTADSLEKSLMLKKIEDRRWRGHQSMRWLDGITDAMDMNLGKLRETVRDREAWHAAVHYIAKCWTRLDDWTTTANKFIISKSQHERISLRRYVLGKQMFIS